MNRRGGERKLENQREDIGKYNKLHTLVRLNKNRRKLGTEDEQDLISIGLNMVQMDLKAFLHFTLLAAGNIDRSE